MTPTVVLEVIGSRGQTPLTAIIDTGFDDELCLPIPLAVTLGLSLIGTEDVELADGTQKRELVFAGSVRFLDQIRPVRIFLTESEDALVGTRLLNDCRLNIDFPTGKVKISRKSSRP